jgi:hypothetical protein
MLFGMSSTIANETFRARVRQILLEDWDPHNAARLTEAHGTYDTYLAPLCDLLRSPGADEQAVVDWLHERERESMCFPSLGTARLRRVARKLLNVGREGNT